MVTVLFLCTSNATRSRIAEALVRKAQHPFIRAMSAGVAPSPSNPRLHDVMAEVGVELDEQMPKSISELAQDEIDIVITLSPEALKECPPLPRTVRRIHWPIPAPRRSGASESDELEGIREVRDLLSARVDILLQSLRPADAELLSKERVYDGRLVKLDLERITLPNGKIAELEIIHHPGASAVVPITPDREIVIIRQYRQAARGFILEVPAGKLDPGESPESCAHREVEEEAGLRASSLHRLGSIFTTPGFTDEEIFLFAATGLHEGAQSLEQDEVIDVLKVPLERAIDMVASGEIVDAKSICCLVRAEQELRAGRIDPAFRP